MLAVGGMAVRLRRQSNVRMRAAAVPMLTGVLVVFITCLTVSTCFPVAYVEEARMRRTSSNRWAFAYHVELAAVNVQTDRAKQCCRRPK